MVPRRVRPNHLIEWQEDLQNQGFSARTVNKHLGSIRQILVQAISLRLCVNRPSVKALQTRRAAPKYYVRNDQFEQVWKATSGTRWPSQKCMGITPAEFWQAALIMFLTYGFRTQELLAYEVGKQSLKWFKICWGTETPNRPALHKYEFVGSGIPTEAGMGKPDPLYLPLTRHSRAAIQKLADPGWSRTYNDRSCVTRSTNLCNTAMCKEALRGVGFIAPIGRGQTKAAPWKSSDKFAMKHLRKTCATLLNRHYRGLAEMVCGWGEREGAKVAIDHYISDELVLVEQLNSVLFLTVSMIGFHMTTKQRPSRSPKRNPWVTRRKARTMPQEKKAFGPQS